MVSWRNCKTLLCTSSPTASEPTTSTRHPRPHTRPCQVVVSLSAEARPRHTLRRPQSILMASDKYTKRVEQILMKKKKGLLLRPLLSWLKTSIMASSLKLSSLTTFQPKHLTNITQVLSHCSLVLVGSLPPYVTMSVPVLETNNTRSLSRTVPPPE